LRHAILEKLTMMRGENCMEASVSVISNIAKTIEHGHDRGRCLQNDLRHLWSE